MRKSGILAKSGFVGSIVGSLLSTSLGFAMGGISMKSAAVVFTLMTFVWGFYIAIVLLALLPVFVMIKDPLSPLAGTMAGVLVGCSICLVISRTNGLERFDTADQTVIMWLLLSAGATVGATVGFCTAKFGRRSVVSGQ